MRTFLPTLTCAGVIASSALACRTSPESPDVFVPGGRFIAGADCNERKVEPGCDRSRHARRMNISVDPFFIDRNLVTKNQYDECVRLGFCGDDQAATDRDLRGLAWVRFENAREYCRRRGQRLPEYFEFERVARGIDGRITPWGDGASPCNESKLTSACLNHKGPAGVRSVAFNPQWVDHGFLIDDEQTIRGVGHLVFAFLKPEDFQDADGVSRAFFRCAWSVRPQ